MKKQNRRTLFSALYLLAAFILWTVTVRLIDVQPIGPQGSTVGLAALNTSFHNLTGVHMTLYQITDWLSLVPLGFAAGFACLGLLQWIKRKRLLAVDRSILVLGGFYMAVMVTFLFFEWCPINYRPILIDGVLEASYPSSTTLLVLCVMPSAILQLNARLKRNSLRRCVTLVLTVFTAFMVLLRLVSGVHWLTDIMGGILLSAGLVLLYISFLE